MFTISIVGLCSHSTEMSQNLILAEITLYKGNSKPSRKLIWSTTSLKQPPHGCCYEETILKRSNLSWHCTSGNSTTGGGHCWGDCSWGIHCTSWLQFSPIWPGWYWNSQWWEAKCKKNLWNGQHSYPLTPKGAFRQFCLVS